MCNVVSTVPADDLPIAVLSTGTSIGTITKKTRSCIDILDQPLKGLPFMEMRRNHLLK